MPGKGPTNKPGSAGSDVFDNAKTIEVSVEALSITLVEDLSTVSTDTSKIFRPNGAGGVEIVSPAAMISDRRDVELYSATNGQTIFSLSNTPVSDPDVVMLVNGITYTNGTDFVVSGTTLTWQDNLFTLEVGDEVQIDYHF